MPFSANYRNCLHCTTVIQGGRSPGYVQDLPQSKLSRVVSTTPSTRYHSNANQPLSSLLYEISRTSLETTNTTRGRKEVVLPRGEPFHSIHEIGWKRGSSLLLTLSDPVSSLLSIVLFSLDPSTVSSLLNGPHTRTFSFVLRLLLPQKENSELREKANDRHGACLMGSDVP